VTLEQALRAYLARANAVDRLLDKAANTTNPATHSQLIAMAEIQALMADAAARIVTASLDTPNQEG
jgi:hypothetical protein